MRNLCFLLIPMGIALLIVSIRNIIRFAKAELFFEMPCLEEEGRVHLPQGKYGIWLSGTSVSGFREARVELYSFYVEEGNYTLSLDGESSVRDRLEASIENLLFKQPVDLSNFTVQIRKGSSIAMFFLAILGINLAAWMILGGVMLPFILAEAGY